MVRVRLVDLPDSPEEEHVRSIPEMMFSVGEEPADVRVLTYLSSGAITRIYNALEEPELQIIRQSAFGKILDLVDKPVFSGRFARYILSRQLKTQKKHETWFRFAGKPIRFALREFAMVTGLPCGKFPLKSKLKLKNSISEKPHWPSLFGKVEVVTVASVIRMLRKRTVEDRLVRIKYACLAILASVLLPTNNKMKIYREHVEAIQDLDQFFSYPWGRLSFDMLMSSNKEKDKIALSQNNFAVKGFVLALQLVMVEAVPCLYEVVQEFCSSSEGDSDDDDSDKSARVKRKTLSPGHARNVDKRTDVLVRSIIEEDPLRPIDASQLVYSDEEDDDKVDNLVYLINTNFQFPKSIYVGGATKIDIDRMRDAVKVGSHLKKSKKPVVSPPQNDPGYIASLVIQNFKPEIQTMRGNIYEACQRVDSIEGSVPVLVHSVFEKLKEDLLDSVKKLVYELIKAEDVGPSSIAKNVSKTPTMVNINLPGCTDGYGIDESAQTIRNILGNLSAYSTPPSSPRLSLGENVSTGYDKDFANGEAVPNQGDETLALSAYRQNYQRSLDLNQPMVWNEVANMVQGPLIDIPSFSLGLTQEEQIHVTQGITRPDFGVDVSRRTVNLADKFHDPQQSRKRKKQKCVPQALVDDYQCGPDIVSRVRKSHKFIFAFSEKKEINRKYVSLLEEISTFHYQHLHHPRAAKFLVYKSFLYRNLACSSVVSTSLALTANKGSGPNPPLSPSESESESSISMIASLPWLWLMPIPSVRSRFVPPAPLLLEYAGPGPPLLS
ncbi:hypothetical protein Bca101_043305 [Brassica carinata]